MLSNVNMNGKMLTIATNPSPPYVFLTNTTNTTNPWVLSGGIEVKLLEALKKHFNFTYRVISCKSDWGIRTNQTWSGLIGKIVTKNADLAFGGLTVTAERSRDVAFSHPHIITSVSFITPSPKPKPKITLVIQPFEKNVWICIILSIITMFFIQWFITKKCVIIRETNIKWAIISVFLKQTLSSRLPNVLSLRILMSSWLLACLVLTASYSGCLYSLMAIPTRVQPINTLDELAAEQKRGGIQVTSIGGSSYFDSLKNSKFGVYKDIGESIQPVKDKEDGLYVVMNGSKPYAYISTRDHLLYGLLIHGSKSFHLPPPTEESTVFLDVMAIAMQKDFQYKKGFNKVISDIKKGGFLDYWRVSELRKLRLKGDPSAVNLDDHKWTSLYLDQLQSAFYLYIIGQIFAYLVFFVEFIYIRKQTINH